MTEVEALIRKAQAGEKESRELLVENNLGLVHHIVKRFLNRGYDPEDLFQIGVIGLMKAIDKFDTGYEVKFSTYAVPLITGEIKRYIRDDGMVKVSRTLKENGNRVKYARQRLAMKLLREPTLSEVASEAALSTDEVILAMEANVQVESIYSSVYQSDGSEIYLVDQLMDQGRDEQEGMLNHMVISELLKGLEKTEQKLIILRYFKNETQTEVARQLGISQVQVSRLEKKILFRLRERLI